LHGAVEVPGVVLEEVEGADSIVDEAGISKAFLVFLGCIEQP